MHKAQGTRYKNQKPSKKQVRKILLVRKKTLRVITALVLLNPERSRGASSKKIERGRDLSQMFHRMIVNVSLYSAVAKHLRQNHFSNPEPRCVYGCRYSVCCHIQ